MNIKLVVYAVVALVLIAAGATLANEHTARVAAESRDKAHRDSLHVALTEAQVTKALYDTALVKYRAVKKLVPFYRTRVDSIAFLVPVDSAEANARVQIIKAQCDSAIDASGRQVAYADSALDAASKAIAAQQRLLTVALHPPPIPDAPRLAPYAGLAINEKLAVVGIIGTRYHVVGKIELMAEADVGQTSGMRAGVLIRF